jgi:SAM-dependent methyltransferase
MTQMFTDAVAYEAMMGRWSSRLAALFLDFAELGDAERVLDVGCGTGSLVKGILQRMQRARVVGIDPAEAFVDYARTRFQDPRASFDCGSALDLPYPNGAFDRSLSLLVFQFLKQPGIAASEMRRVTRMGGTAAACTWDRTGQEMSELFWEECVRLDPDAEEKAQRPNGCNRAGQLAALWETAGFEDVREVTLEMRTEFTCFDDFWLPYTAGVGAQGVYVASLSPEKREVLREALRRRFVGERDQAFSLRAAALAVRGTVPDTWAKRRQTPALYSGLMPASRMILDVRARSALIAAANSSGELP